MKSNENRLRRSEAANGFFIIKSKIAGEMIKIYKLVVDTKMQ